VVAYGNRAASARVGIRPAKIRRIFQGAARLRSRGWFLGVGLAGAMFCLSVLSL